MKHSILILISILFALSVTAQVKQEVIASAGGYNTVSGLSISWTLGETIIPTFKNGDLVLTHGFQSQLIITTVEENINLIVNLKIFPNPASDIVNIQFEAPIDGEIIVYLLDSQGNLVKKDIIESTMVEKQLNMQDLAGGIYYIKLVKGKLVNVYKVVKL
jgi:hypothetical protein